MKFISKFIKDNQSDFRSKNSTPNLNSVLSELSHDLKNNFIAIRAVVGSIEKNTAQQNTDQLGKKIEAINKSLNHAMVLIEMTRVLLMPHETLHNTTQFSILNCLHEAIQTYPFSSDKFLSRIHIVTNNADLIVSGNEHLVTHIFYCLLRNAVFVMYTLENSAVLIHLVAQKEALLVLFEFPEVLPINKQSFFSLGSPQNPGPGFQFIENAMKSIRGAASFEAKAQNCFVVTLRFSVK